MSLNRAAMDHLENYPYTKLRSEANELRILTLLQGGVGDPVRVIISHESFEVENKSPWNDGLLSLEALRETLPKDWKVAETLDERYIFYLEEAVGPDRTSWSHPDKSVDPSSYHAQNQLQRCSVQYEALSYTWGPPEKTNTILVEGACKPIPENNSSGGLFKLQITHNLHEALLHLRRTDITRRLWIDAICINQDDIDERNEQVQRMDNIYKYASRVVVWIGPSTPESDVAMLTLQHLGEQVALTNQYSRFPLPGASEPTWYQPDTHLPFDDNVWDSIQQLLDRPWFSRLWIIQEVQLANIHSILQCGKVEIPWTEFRHAILSLLENNHRPLRILDGVNSVAKLCSDLSASDFSLALWRTMRSSCSDMRDHIYAVLGLLTDELSSRIRPQYLLPVSEVFKQACLEEIKFSGRLELFDLCHIVGRNIHAPSWVPDLTMEPMVFSCLSPQLATGFSSANFIYQEPSTLVVHGVKHSKISRVSEPFDENLTDIATAGKSAETWAMETYVGEGDWEDSGYSDQLLRAFFDNNTRGRFPEEPVHVPFQDWKDFIAQRRDDQGQDPSEETEVSHWTLERALDSLKCRCLIELGSGYIGLGPPGSQNGIHLHFNHPVS
ncbi:hypothetical protein Hte_001169 [Hypoxylon texense]